MAPPKDGGIGDCALYRFGAYGGVRRAAPARPTDAVHIAAREVGAAYG